MDFDYVSPIPLSIYIFCCRLNVVEIMILFEIFFVLILLMCVYVCRCDTDTTQPTHFILFQFKAV